MPVDEDFDEDEPDTGIIEAMLDSDPPAAEELARRKLHAIAKRR